MASKFFEHFVYIAHAMNHLGTDGLSMWDDEDGFYYDELHLSGKMPQPLKVRSMVDPRPAMRSNSASCGSSTATIMV